MSVCRSIKEIKKCNKLVTRGLHILNKDFQLEKENLNYDKFHLSNESKAIFIVNGGLTTGADNVSIMELFVSSGFKGIEAVLMVPGKQYSFVILASPDEAKKAVAAMSGIKCLPHAKNPLYLACIDRVPTIRNTVEYDKPPGLILVEDFISMEEESLLSNLIDWEGSPSQPSEGSTLKHRQVRHFGYEFKYSSNCVDKDCPLEQPIPSELIPICQRLVDSNLMSHFPDQLTVNRYLPGQGIPSHVDTHSSFMGEIVSLSVVGGVAMDFRREGSEEEEEGEGDTHKSVYLPSKSLCVMAGPARFLWSHGICPRKTDIVPDSAEPTRLLLKQRRERVSFTFRKVRDGDCSCQYPRKCDSQQGNRRRGSVPIETKTPSELEQEHVLDVYEKIGRHFSHTRHKPWPKVLEFVQSLPSGSLLLDVGCGNGKYLGHNKDVFQLGSDTSQTLLSICSEKSEVALSNCLSLPFRRDAFDAVICIAVIHHLASHERRKKAVSEILEVLGEGCSGLIYVWALEQRKGKMSTYLKQKRSNRRQDRQTEASESQTQVLQQCTQASKLKTQVSKECSETPKSKMESNVGTQDSQECNSTLNSTPDLDTTTPNQYLKPSNNHSTTLNDNKEIKSLSVHENRTDFIEQDLFVPWKIAVEKFKPDEKEEESSTGAPPVYHRYYHVFKEGELDELLLSFPSVQILNSYYDEGNWCVLFKKKLAKD